MNFPEIGTWPFGEPMPPIISIVMAEIRGIPLEWVVKLP